jgi:hypothetical protein
MRLLQAKCNNVTLGTNTPSTVLGNLSKYQHVASWFKKLFSYDTCRSCSVMILIVEVNGSKLHIEASQKGLSCCTTIILRYSIHLLSRLEHPTHKFGSFFIMKKSCKIYNHQLNNAMPRKTLSEEPSLQHGEA